MHDNGGLAGADCVGKVAVHRRGRGRGDKLAISTTRDIPLALMRGGQAVFMTALRGVVGWYEAARFCLFFLLGNHLMPPTCERDLSAALVTRRAYSAHAPQSRRRWFRF